MTKYYNRITEVDGIKFHSKKEADYYCELKLRQKTHEFLGFSLQPSFVLQDSFIDRDGKKHQAIKYIADFMILHYDGTTEVIDVKGVKTKEYVIKKKLFLAKYPEYKFIENG